MGSATYIQMIFILLFYFWFIVFVFLTKCEKMRKNAKKCEKIKMILCILFIFITFFQKKAIIRHSILICLFQNVQRECCDEHSHLGADDQLSPGMDRSGNRHLVLGE
jgi:hypothetical protein